MPDLCHIPPDQTPTVGELTVLGWQRETCSSRRTGRCPVLPVLRPAPVPAPRPTPTPPKTRRWQPLWPDLEPRIQAAQPERFHWHPANGSGWIGPIHSPLRDDRNPSFSVRPDSETDPGAWLDHATSETGSMADLAQALGLDPRQSRPVAEVGPTPELTLEEFARRRRLDPETLRTVWRVSETKWKGRPALRWPTRLGIDRVKYLDGKKPKGGWVDSGGEAHWYGLGRALELVRALHPDGRETLLCLVNGEPSVWACTQAGVPAVCLAAGEGTAPTPELAEELVQAGVEAVAVVYDRDRTGRKGAHRAVEALRGGGLAAEALELPPDLGEHGDVDDFHRRVGDAGLMAALADLPVLVEGEASATPAVVGTLLSDVQAEAVRWLWAGRIPLAKMTVLDGDPGLGKSTLTLDLAARVTTSGRMPDGSAGAMGGVVLLTAEDGLGDTVRPRLEAAGADLARVVALSSIGTGRDRRPVVLPEDIETVTAAIRRVGAVLVVVDPLMAFLSGKVDSHRDQDVRRALAQLATLAEETGAALVVVRHLNKTAAGNPLYRGGGSIGIVGAARAGLLVARDPADEDRRILATTKCNLAAEPRSWRWRLEAEPGLPVCVRWIEECDLRAADLVCDTRPRHGAQGGAEDFLEAALADGPRPADDVIAEASTAGISKRTLARAKGALGVVARKVGGPGQAQRWEWLLPDDEGCQGRQPWHPSEGCQESTKDAKSADPESWHPSRGVGTLQGDDLVEVEL